MGLEVFDLAWGEDVIPFDADASDGISLFKDPFAEFDFVLEGYAYKREGSTTIDFPWAWGDGGPWGYGGDETSAATIIRYGWRGLVTDANDSPSNIYIPSILTEPLNFEINIPWSGSKGQATSGFGAIEFSSSPDYDDDLAYWSGRTFNLKVGGTFNKGLDTEVTMAYKDYVQRYKFEVEDIEYDEEIARVYVKDGLKKLDVPLQQNKYTGSGTYGGTTQLISQYKPSTYGSCFNVPCVLIDDTNYIYQINDGTVEDITDVRVNGVSWTDAGDSTNLPGETISASNYKTDKSRGLFRLGSQPGGQVTADAKRTTTKGGDVCLEMMDEIGVTEIDRGSFQKLFREDIGFYVSTSPQTALSIIQQLVTSADYYIYVSRAGLITLGGHENPREATADTNFDLRGLLESSLFENDQLENRLWNNSDVLGAGWSDFISPTVTTGIADPMGTSNGFNILDDQTGTEARRFGPITFRYPGPGKVFTVFVKQVTSATVTCGMRIISSGQKVPDSVINFPSGEATWTVLGVSYPDQPPDADLYKSIDLTDWGYPGWWFMMLRSNHNFKINTNYEVWMGGNDSAHHGRSTTYAYPCVYEHRGGPNYPISLPFESWETVTSITDDQNENWYTEGNSVDAQLALSFPTYIKSIRRLPTPPAPKTIKVAYKRNWSPQNEDSLDTSLSQGTKQQYSRESKISEIVENDGAERINPDAHDLYLEDGYLLAEIDANAVRDGILGRVGTMRDLFEVEIVAPLFRIDIGNLVRIYHDRFDLREGKIGEVLRIVETATVTTLHVLIVE